MSHAAFDERVTRIARKHGRMSAGVSYRIGPDGLMVPVPRRPTAGRKPFRAILLLLAMAYACKLLLFVGLGEGVYTSRLDLLRGQGAVSDMALGLLEPDAAMRTAAGLVAGADAAWLRLP
jgi:hypothetical protein